jgi:hypothetical protein
MLKNFLFLFIFIYNFIFLNSFEIEITSDTMPKNTNPFEAAKVFVDKLVEEISEQEIKDRAHSKKKKHKKPHKPPRMHKEVIETRGPGFTTVQVREFMDNSNEDNVNASKSNIPFKGNTNLDNVIGEIVGEMIKEEEKREEREIINKLLNPTPIRFGPPMHMPMPFIFVKSTKKNLKNQNDKTAETPFKIFSQMSNMERMFDSFFKIENQHHNNNGSIKINLSDVLNPSISNESDKDDKDLELEDKSDDNIDKQAPPKNDQNHIDFKGTDLEHKLFKILPAEDEVEKLIEKEMKHVNADLDSEKNKSQKEDNDYSVENEIPKLPEKKIHPYEKKSSSDNDKTNSAHSDNINHDDHLNHTNRISLPETSSLEKIITYSIYIILIILFTLTIKFVLNKIQESEDETKRANTKHSINEIEDELRSMKDKNKLY